MNNLLASRIHALRLLSDLQTAIYRIDPVWATMHDHTPSSHDELGELVGQIEVMVSSIQMDMIDRQKKIDAGQNTL